MRYTTLIDISELPIYRNVNCRLVYLHLTLKAGYHDSDRDIVLTSIRRLAADVGITDAACRHAISQLEQAQLLTRTGGVWMVKKWLLQMEPITTRATTKRQQRAAEAEAAHLLHDVGKLLLGGINSTVGLAHHDE